MQKALFAVDRLSTWVGQAFAWAIVLLTLLITWEVFSRYALNQPHDWALNAQIMLYGVLFMTAGAYTLAKNGHVRGDVLYGFFMPRTQATVDLVLYVLFFLPGIVALTWAGWDYALESLAIREKTFSATPLPLYPFKFVIPFSGLMLLLQGIVEIIRCIACIRDGEWPSRFEKEIFEYISIDERFSQEVRRCFQQPLINREYLLDLANKFRSPHLWDISSEGNWKLRYQIK